MQQPKEYYQAQMSRLTILLKKHRQRRNGITLAKVFLFLLDIYFIYNFANTEYTPYLIAFIDVPVWNWNILQETLKTFRQARSTKTRLTLTLMILTYSGKIPFSKPSTVRLHLTGGINCGDGCSTR